MYAHDGINKEVACMVLTLELHILPHGTLLLIVVKVLFELFSVLEQRTVTNLDTEKARVLIDELPEAFISPE